MYENDTACWWLGVVGDGNERVEQALCFGVDEDHGYSFEHPGFSADMPIWKEWTFERRASLDAEVLATVGIMTAARIPAAEVLAEGRGAVEHVPHVRHLRRVPAR